MMSGSKTNGGDDKAISTGDLLGKAVEAAQSQSEAAQALADAADALAEEEQLLVEKLGLDSVEELESALDRLEGIADDGGDIEPDNMAREARIRSAYMEWCKQFGKESSEDRFPVFSSNFLVMEDFAKESGKEIKLNEYADCTEEEYTAIMSKSAPPVAAPVSAARTQASAPAPALVNGNDDAERRRREAETTAKKQAELQARAAEEAQKRKEAELTRQRELEERRIKLKEWQLKTEDERRAINEKERLERQKEQDARQAKQQADEEAKAIAAAKAQAENDAARVAQRREYDQQAAEIARQQAREWDEKQRSLNKPKAVAPAPKKSNIFSAFQSSKPVEPKVDTSTKVEFELNLPSMPSSSPVPNKADKPLFDFSALNDMIPKEMTLPSVQMSTPVKKATAASPFAQAKKPAAKKEAKPAKTLTIPFLSSPTSSKQDPKATQPTSSGSPTPEIDVSDPVTDAFASFFGSKKKEVKVKQVSPAPAPAANKKAAAPSFSFFPQAAPKPTPTATSPPPARSPAKKAAPSFSFFSPPAPKAPAPSPAPAKSAPKPSFSFFSPPAPKKVPAAKPASPPSKPGFSFFGAAEPKANSAPAQAPASTPKPAFSFFGGQAPASKPSTPAAKKVVPKLSNKPGTLSIFGGGTKPEPKQAASKAAPARPTLSLFGGGAKPQTAKGGPPPGVPELSRWKQNANGSITGRIRGSKSFRDGEEITTSAVAKGAKSGSVIKTGSGSQYYLK